MTLSYRPASQPRLPVALQAHQPASQPACLGQAIAQDMYLVSLASPGMQEPQKWVLDLFLHLDCDGYVHS
jgi:hypothetical protein